MYDFHTLTPPDFEAFCRDLLEAEWNTPVEAFRKGRDKGIDLRAFVGTNQETIVQCKHWLDSGFQKLLSAVTATEAAKVRRLQPRRYVLATTVPLSAGNKDSLSAAFSPHLNIADILGQADLNAMLDRHPAVEKRSFKLWLTSVPLLERILHARVFQQTSVELESIRNRILRYVPTKSRERAVAALDAEHYCIIAGIPGIGKTALAEMLVMEHVADGWEPVVVANDIGEAFQMLNNAKPQIFYYDDFLGKTALTSKLGKNEDTQLKRFIELCRRSQSKRFILTTREYILQQARSTYEDFASPVFAPGATVEMSDYTTALRAKVLFNHLWFSGSSRF